jgi:hypothetical protein
MQLKPFLLDMWLDTYEHGIEFNLSRVKFPAACGVTSTRVLQDTSPLAARSFILAASTGLSGP